MKDSRLKQVSFVCYPIHTYEEEGVKKQGGIDIETCINSIRDKISSYAYILHDKDLVVETGEFKKPHYHVVLVFHKQEHIKPILKLFNTSVYETVKNLNGVIQYLVHKGYDDKYQYSIDSIVSRNLDVKTIINSLKVNNDVESGLFLLLEKVKTSVDIIDITDFALKNGLYCVLRNNYNIIKDYLKCYKEREKIALPTYNNNSGI